jgi:hypothetical protein
MLHGVIRSLRHLTCVIALCSCVGVTLEPTQDTVTPLDAWPVEDTFTPMDATTDGVVPDLILVDAPVNDDSRSNDWIPCDTHCDCPVGQDCINDRCVEGSQAIHCCGALDCPAGEDCWTKDGMPGICP